MAIVTDETMTRVTRYVDVVLDESEFIEVPGDRKPNGGYRVARVVAMNFGYEFGADGWRSTYPSVKAFKQQQRADGTWGEPRWDRWPGFGQEQARSLCEKYLPTAEVTIEIKESK